MLVSSVKLRHSSRDPFGKMPDRRCVTILLREFGFRDFNGFVVKVLFALPVPVATESIDDRRAIVLAYRQTMNCDAFLALRRGHHPEWSVRPCPVEYARAINLTGWLHVMPNV